MHIARLRLLFVGRLWSHLAISLLAGLVSAALLVVLAGFVLDLRPAPVLLIFVIPVSILITYDGGGLVSSWIVVFPYAFYALLKACWGFGGLCIPPHPLEILPEAVAAALIAGTIGYAFPKMTAWRYDNPPAWVPVAYFSAVVTLAGILLVFLDKVVQSCIVISC